MKKTAATHKPKRSSGSNAARTRDARAVAQKANPNWKPLSPSIQADADTAAAKAEVSTPELSALHAKYFGDANSLKSDAQDSKGSAVNQSELVDLEPKNATDFRTAIRKTSLVENGKVIGETG